LEYEKHFHYILWVVADREEKLKQQFSDFAVELHLRHEATDITAGANALKDHLRTTGNLYISSFSVSILVHILSVFRVLMSLIFVDKKWLIILDNAKDDSLIKDWWPYGPEGAILITANDRIFATRNIAGDGEELSTFDEDTAVEFVLSEIPAQSRVGKFDAREEALALVRRLSYLPLAISTAVGQINKLNCSIRQYNQSYSDHRAFWRDSSKDDVDRPSAPYSLGLKDVLESAVQYEGDAKTLSEVFSLLEGDNIQEELLDRAAESADFKEIGFVKNRLSCIQTLCDTPSFIAKNSHDPSRYPGFHIHGLFQKYIRESMTDLSRERCFDLAVRIVCLPLDDEGTGYPRIFREFFYHAQSLIEYQKAFEPKFVVSVNFIELLRTSSW
jgi:hypothetical protein